MTKKQQTDSEGFCIEASLQRSSRGRISVVKRYRVFCREEFYDNQTERGHRNANWLMNYLDDLAKGKPRKRMPPGVSRIEEITDSEP